MATVYQREFYEACKKGQIENVDGFSRTTINVGFYYACEEGHLNVVKWLFSNGADNTNGFSVACRNGHLSVVKYLISRIKFGCNNEFINACVGGLSEIAQFLIETKEITSFGEGLFCAYIWRHWELVDFLISNRKGLFDMPDSFVQTNWFNDSHVFELLEMGVLVESFITCAAANIKCKDLFDDIQTFKTRAFVGIQNALIPELSKLIVEYSLK